MVNINFSTIIAYKKMIVNAAIILLALLIAYNLYNSQIKEVSVLRANKDIENKKNNILNIINENEKKILRYRKFVNNKDIYSVMNIIIGLAKEADINITSFKPSDEKSFLMYSQYLYNLKVKAQDYLTLGKFVSLLENSQEVFAVESLNISPNFSEAGNEEKGPIFEGVYADLRISTIIFK